jgi:hypothetical protein
VASSEVNGSTNPRCSCGSIMKKPYVKPEAIRCATTDLMKVFGRVYGDA